MAVGIKIITIIGYYFTIITIIYYYYHQKHLTHNYHRDRNHQYNCKSDAATDYNTRQDSLLAVYTFVCIRSLADSSQKMHVALLYDTIRYDIMTKINVCP